MASISQVAQSVSAVAGVASGIAQNLGFGNPGAKGQFGPGKLLATINQQNGLYRNHHFAVTIAPPSFLSGDSINAEKISMLCNSSTLPGKQILASDHKRQQYGTFDRRAWGASFTDIPLTFYLDGRGDIVKFFYKWQQYIMNTVTQEGNNAESASGAMPFEAAYHENYSTTMELKAYDVKDNTILTYKFIEAWPFQVGDVTVAWAETDQFSLLPVQMTYRSYHIEQSPAPWVNPDGRGFNLVTALGLIAGAAGVVASGSFPPKTIGDAVNVFNNAKVFRGAIGNAIAPARGPS
jgi:hypothetical protein